MKKLMFLAATLAVALVGCKEPEAPEAIAPIFPDGIQVVEEVLTASPLGHTADDETPLTVAIEAEGSWKVEAVEDYEWISVIPESGEGNATITFVIEDNESGQDRLAEFEVFESFTATNAEAVNTGEDTTKDIRTYSIIINQVKKESNLGDGTLAFLQAIVEGKMLGAATPNVDNWYVVDETFPSITMSMFEGGKMEIVAINGKDLIDWPEVLDLPELTDVRVRDSQMQGKMLPQEWNSPKLKYITVAVCGLTGPIPEGLASSTAVCTHFLLDQNDFYGALPHFWASGTNGGSGVCEGIILANVGNRKEAPEEGFENNDNDGLGYMVPATCDVRLNHLTENGDRNNSAEFGFVDNDGTAIKLGGVFQGNYIGFEKGWGQERYEAYDPDAVIGDKEIWSNYRAQSAAGGWAYYYSNLGFVNADGSLMYYGVPQIMMEWDQSAADAYTASCK